MERSGSRGFGALALRALAAGLLVAGVVAVLAVLSGSFDRGDGRLIATSIGFGLFSAAAAGGAARFSGTRPALRLLGAGGVVAAVLGFALLVAALWLPHVSDTVWRAWAITAITALWCWHAGTMLGAARAEDTAWVTGATLVAVGALSLDAVAGIAAVSGRFDELRSPEQRQILGAVLIVAIVGSVLVPILRRLEAAGARGPRRAEPLPPAPAPAPAWPVAEPRPRLGLDRVAPGAWIVVPALVVAVFALGWIAHRPQPTGVLRGVTSVVTVTTPAPPTAPARSGFTAKDAGRIIGLRRKGFDDSAKARVGTLASMVELCFARSADFTACDTAAEVPDAAAAGLSWGGNVDQVAVDASTVSTYSITARSRTGGGFTISRDARGAEARTCTPAGTGGCGSDGRW